jgi:hypothetical protein
LAFARVRAVAEALGVGVEARGAAAVFGAGIGAPVFFEVASAPLAPPWPEQVPRPVELDVVPSAQIVVTCAPGVFLVTAFDAFVSLFTTFFSRDTAFLSTPPCPEQAPRPADTDVVPSLQIVAAAWASSDAAENSATADATAPSRNFRADVTVPPSSFVSRNDV